MSDKTTIIISEGRHSDSSRRTLERELAEALQRWPHVAVVTLPHLYDLAPEGPAMQHLQAVSGDIIVVASLYPRAAYWVLDANQVKGRIGRTSFFSEEEQDAGAAEKATDRTIWCLDIRGQSDTGPLLQEIRQIVAESQGIAAEDVSGDGKAAAGEITRVDETVEHRWYPVIDYGRCANCLECMNFCLFGVFGIDESGQLMIEQPDACRDGCPACSRVCPSQAIMFPPHHTPAIAGDHTAPAETYTPDLVQLSGGGSPLNLAAAERDRALEEAAPDGQPPSDQPPARDELDALVDDLDKMDL